MEIVDRKRPWWQRISPVWLVPVVALVISLGVAYNSYSNRGRLITVSFQNAAGLEAGSTVLKYRDVTVGRVEEIGFSQDLGRVQVQIRVAKAVAPYIDSDAKFWVVRPEVSVRGVTGLNTVLSGSYIAGDWDNVEGTEVTSFKGMDQAPLTGGPGVPGTKIQLRLANGNQISAGAPILYKGIEVGSVSEPRLSEDGSLVLLDAFIKAPYDQRITSNTRFWDASGFSVKLGASGVQLDVRSLASLIEGGITFDTVVSGGKPLEPGQAFKVYADEQTARDSVFTAENDNPLDLSAVFDGSIDGLSEGADVMFNGLKVGKVTDLGAFTEGEGTDRRVRMLVNMELSTAKLGLGDEPTADKALKVLQDFVKNRKVRARLATGSIFTGSLMVELVPVDDAPPAEIDLNAKPYPRVPTAAADVSSFAATSQGVFERLNALPVEDLMKSAIGTLDAIRGLAQDPDLRRVPGSAADLMDDTRKLVNSDDIQKTLDDLRATAGQARSMVEDFRQGQAVANLVSAIDKAGKVMDNLGEASAQFPEISRQIETLSGKLNTIPVEDLANSARKLVDSADAMIDQDTARQLPGALADALREVSTFLGQVREGGAVENTNQAISAAEQAANSINDAAKELPALSDKLSALVDNANRTVAGYGTDSRFNSELTSTLRTLQRAADNLASLAKMLERNPNSLILGR